MVSIIPASELLDKHDLNYFKEGSTFGALSEKAILFLLNRGEIIRLEPGDRLFTYGDKANGFFIILEECINFYKPSKSGDCHIRDYCFGMEVGFMAMIGLHDRSGTGKGGDNGATVLEVTTALFSELQQELPNDFGVLLLNLAREMSRRLREADNRLAEVE